MPASIDEVIDSIAEMTLTQLNELVARLKERFPELAEIQAAPAMVVTGPGVGPAVEEEEEKTEFDLVLKEVGGQRIQVIKALREVTGLGLKEAKEAVDSLPFKVKESVPKEEAEEAKKQLEEVGASVDIV